MYKQILTAVSLAVCLAGPAAAANDRQRGKVFPERQPIAAKAPAGSGRRPWPGIAAATRRRPEARRRGPGRGRDRMTTATIGAATTTTGTISTATGAITTGGRDDDWRRRGWHYDGGRNDGWRYYRGHDHRHWRYVPPYRYGVDFGYRSGYELAWRDWLNHGRYDRYWRRSSFYGYGSGYTYRAGYEAGWRDAALYYSRGYRPNYWSYDSSGGWYFGFSIPG